MSKLSHALRFRCPKCGKGKLFSKPGIFEMDTHCTHCGLKYEKEVGFYYGAMYISYALNIAFFVVALVLFYAIEDQVDWRWYMTGYVVLTLLFSKLIFRLSRSLWLYINH